MIRRIIKFEILNRLKQPMFYFFFALMMFQAIWFIQGAYEVYINDATHMNGAALFYRSFAGGGIVLTIVIALVTGTALYRDIQYKTGSIIYPAAKNDKKFFLAKFFAAYAINLLLGLGIFVGLAITPYVGIGAADKFGAMPWGQMFHGFFVFTATNLFIYTAFAIASLVVFKRIGASYLSTFFITLIFFICETVRPTSSNPEILKILDPASFVYAVMTLEAIPADAKNYTYIPLGLSFWINRAIWIGLSLLYLIVAFKLFTFKRFIQKTSSKKKKVFKEVVLESTVVENEKTRISLPKISTRFVDYLRKLFRLTLLEFKSVVRTRGFKLLILILSIIFILKNLLWNESFYIGASHPLTSIMTNTRIAAGTWLTIILMIWTTELLFKDRSFKIWQVKDALPIPAWLTVLPKVFAMSMVAFILAAMFMVFGILAQILQGATNEINIGLYISDVFGYKWGWLNYLQMIAIVVLFAGLTANRFATHILSVWFFFFNMISFELKIIEELRFIYMFVPGVDDYSEMNGYGIWETSIPWFWLLWTIMAIIFVFVGVYFWKRGADFKLKEKLSFKGKQLNFTGRAIVAGLVIAFVFLQSFIVKNVNELDNFESKLEKQKKSAEYEKQYKKFNNVLQPKIVNADVHLDFYPEKRMVKFKAQLALENVSKKQGLEKVYFNIPDFTSYSLITWNGNELKPLWYNKDLGIMAMSLPIKSCEYGVLEITGTREHKGFTQDKFSQQPEITFNGSFLSVRDILPTIGYQEDKELKENRYRGDWNLLKLESRMEGVGNEKALHQSIFTPDAERFKGKITISTSHNQFAFAPGKKIKTWKEKNRNFYSYQLENNSPFNWYFGSAVYSRDTEKYKNLEISVLYHPTHQFNIEFYKEAIKKTYDFVIEEFGEYPYTETRIIEIPYYQETLYSFPNTIAISEKEGWFADTKSEANKTYMSFGASTQMITHWITEYLNIANVQGANMLRYALPECLSLQVVSKLYGDKAVENLIIKKQGVYYRDRGNEPNKEPALIYADGIEYLEKNKGTTQLYNLSKKLGFKTFNAIVLDWIKSKKGKPARFIDFYETIKNTLAFKNLKEEDATYIKNGFEKVEKTK